MSLVYILREANERLPGANGARSNLYKIGKGQGAIEDRIAALQTGNPRPIEAVRVFPMHDAATAFYLETILHNQNTENRIPGSEWFYFSEAQLQSVIDTASRHQIELEQLVADESRFCALTVTSDTRAPDAEEIDRFASVKTIFLEPRANEKRQRAVLDIQRKLFVFRKVLLGTPSLSQINLQEGQRRFDLTRFKSQYPNLVEPFMRTGARTFRWTFRAPPAARLDHVLIEGAASSVSSILRGGDSLPHRDLGEQIHEALRGVDERDVMAQLRTLIASEANRKVPERLERAWFSHRVGSASGLTGICTCTVPAARLNTEALRAHLTNHHPELLEQFMHTGSPSLRVSSPYEGMGLEAEDSTSDE
jgi:hypothetical protein